MRATPAAFAQRWGVGERVNAEELHAASAQCLDVTWVAVAKYDRLD